MSLLDGLMGRRVRKDGRRCKKRGIGGIGVEVRGWVLGI